MEFWQYLVLSETEQIIEIACCCEEVGFDGVLLGELRRLRREAGRVAEPFEIVVPLIAPPGVDLFRRMEDAGVTSLVNWPFRYGLGARSSLDQKRLALEQFARDFIEPLS